MDQTIPYYFSPASRLVRRNTCSGPASRFNPGRGIRRRHGFVAMLLVTDHSRVADAFGGVALGVASEFPVGSVARRPGSATAAAAAEDRRGVRGEGRRVMVRPRPTTLAPTADAGEGRALSGEPASLNGGATVADASASQTVTLEGAKEQAGVRGDKESGQGDQTQLGVVGRAPGQDRRSQGQAIKALRASPTIVSFRELNSRKVDPSLVRQSVVHYLAHPERLTRMQFTNLGMASSRHCDIRLATEVCEQARLAGTATDVRFMTNLVNAAAKARRWVMASQLMQLMRSYGVPPNEVTYTSVLSEMSKAKQASDRLKHHHMAAEMIQTEGLQRSLFAYNALISGCAAGRGYDRAIGYFNDMKREGVQPDEMTFSSLIATTRDGSARSPERGFAAVQMMKEAGLRPNTYCMNSLMAVNVHARQPNTALEIFKEMGRDGIPRDVVSYNTAIAACDKLRDAEAAVRLLQQARESGIVPDMFSYNSVISALGHSSLWQEATKIFEEMHEAGVVPSLMTYNTLISGCVRAEAPNEALSVFNLMKQKRIKRDQYSFAGALHASMHLRDYELAIDLLEEMVDMGMVANAEGYATGIRTCARCSKSDEAVYLYANQLRMTVVPSKVTYKALLEAFADCKDAERAAWVLDEMREMQTPIEHGHLMDVLYACTNESHIALQVLRLNDDPDHKMYARALEVCITAGDYEASSTVMEMMERTGLQPEPEQEKRMLRKCVDPLWASSRELARAKGGGGEEEGERKGSDFWRERDGLDG
eukprot:g9136.t1